MEYRIENELLSVTVSTRGAQLRSIQSKCDGVEHLWQGDPNVWAFQAPILFPYCGRLPGGQLRAKGGIYEPKTPHGFARFREHTLVKQRENSVTFELVACDETLALWPYKFRLLTTYTLCGETLHHTLSVENLDGEKMPFGIGYHPGFALPFDENHVATDYELRFSQVESPICLATPGGFVSGETYRIGTNIDTIPIDENLFANDSHCMTGLNSRTLGIYEKDSDRAVVVELEGFPYCLLWSQPGMPKFVCIEPWHSLPSLTGDNIDWNEKPAAAILNPGETYSTTMKVSFIR